MNKKLSAVAALRDLDHVIFNREESQALCDSMGVDSRGIPVYAMEHHPEEFKGARLKGCTEIGERRISIGADELAVWLCEQLDIEYASKMGRGSQLRECCNVLEAHFSKA